MKQFLTALTLVAVLVAAPLTAVSQEGPQMTDTEKQVLAVVEGMTAAFRAKNIDGVMNAYEDNATVVFERGVAVRNSAQYRAMYEGAFMLNPVFEYSGHEVYVADDIAIHIAPWTMTGQTPDGQDIADNGLSVAVLRRQSDGEWLMVIDNPYGARLLENE